MNLHSKIKTVQNKIERVKKKALLTAGVSAMLLTGCGQNNHKDKQSGNTAPTAEQLEAQRIKEQQARQRARTIRLNELTDSLETKYGYDYNEYYKQKGILDSLKRELDYELDYKNHKWVELKQKVQNSNAQIAKKHTDAYIAKASEVLEKYGLSVDEKDYWFNGYASGYETIDGGEAVGDFRIWHMMWWHEEALRTIENSSYGDMRKNEIKEKIQAIYDKELAPVEQEQQKARRSIEKKYEKYYPALANEDDKTYTYLTRYLVGRAEVEVYDQDLQVDFFGDKDAKYELKEVKPHQWQVEKTSKDGKKSKTKVFNHNVEYKKYEIGYDDLENCEKGSLSFEPGKNMGVRIHETKILYIKKGENDARWTEEEVAAKKKELEEQIEIVRPRVEELQNAKNRAYEDAEVLLQKEEARAASDVSRSTQNTQNSNTTTRGGRGDGR